VGQAIATHVLQAELDAVIRARHEVELLRRLKRRLQFAGAFIPTVEDHVPLERARIERVVEELRTSLDEEAQEIRSRLLNTKVLTIAPDNQLGGFVSGTLNFSPSAIARWQSLGRDMGTTIIDTVSFVTVRDALRTMQLGAPGDV
jgi:hypothetical protein